MATNVLRGTASLWIDSSITGDTLPVLLEWSNTSATGVSGFVDLPALTDVTLTAPTSFAGTNTVLILIPPPTNLVTWVIKGNAADIGTSLRTAQPTVLGYGGGTTILRATAVLNGVRYIWM